MLLIEFVRRSRGWTQAQSGQLVGIPQPSFSLIERGRLVPTADQLFRLARTFDVAPDDVLRPVAVARVDVPEAVTLGRAS